MKKLIVIVLAVLLLAGCGCSKKNENNNSNVYEGEYLEITYKGDKEVEADGYELYFACLTFYEDSDYELYDCDSEPTSYAFDSESDCSYKYYKEKKEIVFNDCNPEYGEINYRIKIKEWTKDKFSFYYEGELKEFLSEAYIDKYSE